MWQIITSTITNIISILGTTITSLFNNSIFQITIGIIFFGIILGIIFSIVKQLINLNPSHVKKQINKGKVHYYDYVKNGSNYIGCVKDKEVRKYMKNYYKKYGKNISKDKAIENIVENKWNDLL